MFGVHQRLLQARVCDVCMMLAICGHTLPDQLRDNGMPGEAAILLQMLQPVLLLAILQTGHDCLTVCSRGANNHDALCLTNIGLSMQLRCLLRIRMTCF